MKHWPFALLACANLAAHELSLTVDLAAPAVVVRASYGGADGLAFGKVEVAGAGEKRQGQTDRRGYFSWVPETAGRWTVVVDDEMGHRVEAAVEVPANFSASARAGASGGGVSRLERLLAGLGLLAGLFGFWYGWRARRTLAAPLLLLSLAIGQAQDRPRVLVLTDIANEPDDEESLVRFLVYANEYDVEGLVATTSVWLREKTRQDLIEAAVDAYAQVRDNLARHAPGYPAAAELKQRIRTGQPGFGMAAVGNGRTTPGSRLIVEAVDRPDPRPIWISVWGGANTLAQALWDVKYSRSAEDLARFVSKLRVYSISDQDDAGRWLRITFPDLFYVVSPSAVDHREYWTATWTGISGDRHYRNGPMEDFALVDNPWLEENVIRGHGPLGARYPKLAYIMEGDTPAFLGLIDNGLGWHLSPSYGGWGGRYELRQSYGETRPIWTNSRDTVKTADGREHTSNQATIWRWRRAFQHDFAARMDWCVQPPESANHNPRVALNGDRTKRPLELEVKPGESVELRAEAEDPDGHRVTLRWFAYPEAGACAGPSTIAAEGGTARVTAPAAKQPCTAHVIVEAMDAGEPALYSYRRAVLRVRP